MAAQIRSARALFILSLLATSSACTDELSPVLPTVPTEPTSATAIPPQFAVRTLDQVLLELSDQIPGFGGVAYDEAGNIQVALTDLSHEAIARPIIADFMRNRPQASTALPGQPLAPMRFVQSR